MRKFTSCLLIAAVFYCLPASAQSNIVTYKMGGVNSDAFTTNNFRCIGIGKGNRIWAGTLYGGLYTFDDFGFNIWRKSDSLTNVSINDIKADADSGIWIGQSGTQTQSGNSNIAGGINYFPAGSDLLMNFYSVLGTSTHSDLQSRNVRSIWVDKSFGSNSGLNPRVWAAQGTYITSFNTKRGGLSIGLNPYLPYFVSYTGGYATATNATPISEAVGGNSEEVWISARMNNGGSQILRYRPSGTYIGFYGPADTSLFVNGFTAQAIHFDGAGNRWIGMKQGGLIVKTPTGWVKMDDTTVIKSGSQINPNAITSDDYGNVYIGTTNGLVEYQSQDYYPLSTPGYAPSYKRYTTLDTLPSNNITGLAYDKKYGRLLITSDSGVTFMNKREPHIKGVVFDVAGNIDDTTAKYAGFKKTPFLTGVTVRLLKNNVEQEFTIPNAFGIFELKNADETSDYTVEIKTVRDGKTMLYIYNHIRNHTLMEPTLMPFSLIKELEAFKPKMTRRCFPFKLSFDIEINDLLCTEGFDSTGYEWAQDAFFNPNGINHDHRKIVDNLGDYYLAMASVYKLGGQAVDLATDVVANLFDAVDALRGTVEFAYAWKYPPSNIDRLDELDETYQTIGISAIKLIKETLVPTLGLINKGLTNDNSNARKIFERCIGGLNEVADVLIEMMENGRNQAKLKVVLDNLKRVVATAAAVDYYHDSYINERQPLFISETSQAAYDLKSELTFQAGYDNLYNPFSNSVVKAADDQFKKRKGEISNANDVAKYSDIASTGFEGGSALATVLGGPAAAAVLKGFALAAKAVKTTALTAAMTLAAVGADEIGDMSETIRPRAGLQRNSLQPIVLRQSSVLQATPDSLIAIKTRFNQRLATLQSIYTASGYDSVAYIAAYKQLRREDSLYTDEMTRTVRGLLAASDAASAGIPQFSGRMRRVVDTFVSQQYNLRMILKFQNLGFFFDTDKSIHSGGLDSLSNEIRITNDSAVNGIVELINLINTNSIVTPASLEEESYQVNHSRVPGTAGTIVYKFKNYGGQTQNNVSFKISPPGGGYNITGADSVNVGNVAPGQTVQVSFAFTAPLFDSIGHYTVNVKAANGIYSDVEGSLYVVDPTKVYSIRNGNWNDPATWSTNTVPVAANGVYVSHNVVVNVDAVCKTITVNKPGEITVNAGKKITVLE